MSKVPTEHQFVDLSDYARPFAHWIVNYLVNTQVNAIHMTAAFIIVGFLAGYLYLVDTYLSTLTAGLLLLLKSGLDAADGSLARAQNRPSKVGRFLDAIGDFAVNVVLIAAITATLNLPLWAGILLFATVLASITWQCTIFNFYYVTYRWQYSGDTTSSIDESEIDEDLKPWDNVHVLRVLHRLYLIIYAWQDRWVMKIEQAIGTTQTPITQTFMTLASMMGLGTQLAILTFFSVFNKPEWGLYAFLTIFNFYWVGLILYRRATAHR